MPVRRIIEIEPRLSTYIWFTPWHPARTRFALGDQLLSLLYKYYDKLPMPGMEDTFASADLIVFESSPVLLLFRLLKRINPTARYIYRVSDDLRLLRNHPIVLSTEAEVASEFDVISTPSQYIFQKFRFNSKSRLEPHGLDKEAFNEHYENPYQEGTKNAVFVGSAYLDRSFLRVAAEVLPNLTFHVIGPLNNIPVMPNIRAYGEMPFRATIPYIKYADIGLHTLEYAPGAESFSDSLKVLQYTYCGLPIVAPTFLRTRRTNMHYYNPGQESSIYDALISALGAGPYSNHADVVPSWTDLVERWAKPA